KETQVGKLPSDLGSQVFADSPLRPTAAATKKSSLVSLPASDAAVELAAESVDVPVEVAAEVRSLPSPKSGTLPAANNVKMTVYLSKAQVDALEEAVFRRRRAGERIGNTDLMREIVDDWLRRKSGCRTPSGS